MVSMFSGFITSKIRIKILTRLFLNPKGNAYLRELSEEFSASPSHVKIELDQLKEAGLLSSYKKGRQILFHANTKHPLFNELQSMVQKTLGMDKILESMIMRLGNLEAALLIDDYAEGKDTGIIDLILVGDIDHANLRDLTVKTEKYIDRKIRTLTLSSEEYDSMSESIRKRPQFLLWKL